MKKSAAFALFLAGVLGAPSVQAQTAGREYRPNDRDCTREIQRARNDFERARRRELKAREMERALKPKMTAFFTAYQNERETLEERFLNGTLSASAFQSRVRELLRAAGIRSGYDVSVRAELHTANTSSPRRYIHISVCKTSGQSVACLGGVTDRLTDANGVPLSPAARAAAGRNGGYMEMAPSSTWQAEMERYVSRPFSVTEVNPSDPYSHPSVEEYLWGAHSWVWQYCPLERIPADQAIARQAWNRRYEEDGTPRPISTEAPNPNLLEDPGGNVSDVAH